MIYLDELNRGVEVFGIGGWFGGFFGGNKSKEQNQQGQQAQQKQSPSAKMTGFIGGKNPFGGGTNPFSPHGSWNNCPPCNCDDNKFGKPFTNTSSGGFNQPKGPSAFTPSAGGTNASSTGYGQGNYDITNTGGGMV